MVKGRQDREERMAMVENLARRDLGLSAADAYIFEDSFNGIRAAHAAGGTPVMVPDLMEPTDEIRALCAGVYATLQLAADAIMRGDMDEKLKTGKPL